MALPRISEHQAANQVRICSPCRAPGREDGQNDKPSEHGCVTWGLDRRQGEFPMNDWAKIIAAVKEPVSLAALGLLIFMVVLRTVVQKIEPVKGRHGFELARTIVTYTAILALVVAIVSIGYKTYELKAHSVAELKTIQSQETIELSKIAATQSKPPISRVGMETLLQKHRASIEECLQSQPKTLYLDFALKDDADHQLNLDIFLGEEVGHIWAHPTVSRAGIFDREKFPDIDRVHDDEGNGPPAGDTYFIGGDKYPPRVTAAARKKLSVAYPKINGCILDVLRDSLAGVSSPETPFIHRYVTNNGIIKSREFPEDLDDKISEALEKAKFEDAESVIRHAKAIGFAISDANVVTKARALWAQVEAKEINEEDYREALGKLLPNHIVWFQPEDR
jgi:hypothetical protein